MKDKIITIIGGIIITLLIALCAFIVVSGFTGCARVQYKEHTQYIECNVGIMMAQVKSIKGNESFEIGPYIDRCYNAIDRVRCTAEVYGDPAVYPVDEQQIKYKKLEYLQCLSEGK
jgi:hypothetical protein